MDVAAAVVVNAVSRAVRAPASAGPAGRRFPGGWTRAFSLASPWLAGAGLVALVMVVLATLSLTSFDRTGTVFLGGVLTASVLSSVSQAANARWALARRNAQLAATRARLAVESSARSSAERALAALRERERLVHESLPAMLAYVGTDGRLRYHNRAFARWLKLDDDAIDGHCVEELLGEAAFREAAPRLSEAFAGRDVRYERVQQMRDGTRCRLQVQYLPRYLAHGEVEGVFALLTDLVERAADPFAQGAACRDPAARLRSALEEDEFTLHLQPIAPLAGAGEGSPMGEVLLRMNEEEEKHLPPGGFIPIADELGLLHELDRWVVRHVIELAAAQRASAPVFMVNLWRQSILDETFAAFVRERLQLAGIGGESLCFELAESDLLENDAAYRAFVGRLRGMGCRFAICGFGRDPRALALLRTMRVEYVKLDAGLVLAMLRDHASLVRVTSVVESARAAGLSMIAECVESDQARAALARMGVHFAQGFGIARPKPVPSTGTEREAVA